MSLEAGFANLMSKTTAEDVSKAYDNALDMVKNIQFAMSHAQDTDVLDALADAEAAAEANLRAIVKVYITVNLAINAARERVANNTLDALRF